jgi:hypothetical protein
MVASQDTISQVYRVIRKYLTKDRITRLLDDLEKIPGNQSFRATIIALTAEHERSK